MSEEREQDWIGVDLDGTLAEFHKEEYFSKYGPETIGEPILGMIHRVLRWVRKGKRVKIFTARVSPITATHLGTTAEKMELAIHSWLRDNLGFDLEVTHEKDCFMIELWDDISLMEVKRNTGEIKLFGTIKIMNNPLPLCNEIETKKGGNMSKFNLEIRPAVPVELRHQISELIEQHGYSIYGQGEFMDKSACDISFDDVDEPKREMYGIEAKEGETNEISQTK